MLLHSDVALWSPPEEPKMGCTIGGALSTGGTTSTQNENETKQSRPYLLIQSINMIYYLIPVTISCREAKQSVGIL
jgi:hypothetical protein